MLRSRLRWRTDKRRNRLAETSRSRVSDGEAVNGRRRYRSGPYIAAATGEEPDLLLSRRAHRSHGLRLAARRLDRHSVELRAQEQARPRGPRARPIPPHRGEPSLLVVRLRVSARYL